MGNGNGWNEIGNNQYHVLSYLGVGDALHSTQSGINENQHHSDNDTRVNLHFKKAGKHHPNTPHLPSHVSEAYKNGAEYGDKAGYIRVIPIPHEIRHGKFTKFAQVRGQKKGEKNISTCPANKVNRSRVAGKRNDPSHGNKRSGTHPIGPGGHAVEKSRHAMARDIKTGGASNTCGNSNANVEGKGKPYDQPSPTLNIHLVVLYVKMPGRSGVLGSIVIADAASITFIQPLHDENVRKDNDNEGNRSTLLGHPKPKRETSQFESIECIHGKNAEDATKEEPKSHES